jgi:hypothetical protein
VGVYRIAPPAILPPLVPGTQVEISTGSFAARRTLPEAAQHEFEERFLGYPHQLRLTEHRGKGRRKKRRQFSQQEFFVDETQ